MMICTHSDAESQSSPSIFSQKISICKSAFDHTPNRTLNVLEMLHEVQSDRHKVATLNARNMLAIDRQLAIPDPKDATQIITPKYDHAKTQLPAMAFSGVFRYVNKESQNFVSSSGLYTLDIDHLDPLKLYEIRWTLCEDRHVIAAAISPSGEGIKVFFWGPQVSTEAEFQRIFNRIRQYVIDEYDVFPDTHNNIDRLCFLMWDSDLEINYNVEQFEIDLEEIQADIEAEAEAERKRTETLLKQVANLSDTDIDATLKDAFSNQLKKCQYLLEHAGTGKRHLMCLGVAQSFGELLNFTEPLGLWREEITVEFIRNFDQQPGERWDSGNAQKTIADGLKRGKANPKSKKEFVAEYLKKIGEKETTLDKDSISNLLGELEPDMKKKQPEEPPALPEWAFWIEAGLNIDKNPKIVIKPSLYLDFLADHGFRIFMKRGDPVVVRETDDGMDKTTSRGRTNSTVKEFVLATLKEADCMDVVDALLFKNTLFSLDVLDALPEMNREKAKQSLFSEVDTDVYFDTPVEKEQPLITFQGDDWETVLLSTDNFMGFSAHSGVGKTQAMELYASMAIAPDCEKLSHSRFNTPTGLIVWYDTERSMGDCVGSLKRIKDRTGAWKEENRHMLNAAGNGFARLIVKGLKGVEDQQAYILEHLDDLQEPVSLVILDGALDLVDSMNAEHEAKAFTNNLMLITKKLGCGVIVTVHANTSKDQQGSGMGHIGKAIERKCTAFLQIQAVPNEEGRDIKRITTDFPSGKVRNGRRHGVDDYFEFYDGRSHFIEYEASMAPKKESKLRNEVEGCLEWIFANDDRLRHSELVQKYMEKSGKSGTSAKKHIKQAADDWKFLAHDGDFYFLDSKPF